MDTEHIRPHITTYPLTINIIVHIHIYFLSIKFIFVGTNVIWNPYIIHMLYLYVREWDNLEKENSSKTQSG